MTVLRGSGEALSSTHHTGEGEVIFCPSWWWWGTACSVLTRDPMWSVDSFTSCRCA